MRRRSPQTGRVRALRELLTAGLFVTSPCNGPIGTFVNPISGACANASDSSSYGCAFGSGSTCVLCDVAALCPGGARAWPRPGFYSASEILQHPASCPPPSGRCLGWDVAAGASRCGTPYLSGSYSCASCASGYAMASDGSCLACPPFASAAVVWARYNGLAWLGFCYAGLSVVIGAAAWAARKSSHSVRTETHATDTPREQVDSGRGWKRAYHAVALVSWGLLAAQVCPACWAVASQQPLNFTSCHSCCSRLASWRASRRSLSLPLLLRHTALWPCCSSASMVCKPRRVVFRALPDSSGSLVP